jgi:hypothetical protein
VPFLIEETATQTSEQREREKALGNLPLQLTRLVGAKRRVDAAGIAHKMGLLPVR